MGNHKMGSFDDNRIRRALGTLTGDADLAKGGKYTRREPKPGGGYRYFYDDHGPGGGKYSVHKEGGNWKAHFHDGDNTHPVSKDGDHAKHPVTNSVVGADHKSKGAAEAAIAQHSTRQSHAGDHGKLGDQNTIRAMRNMINRQPNARGSARLRSMTAILASVERGGSKADAIEAGGKDGASLYAKLHGLANKAQKSESAQTVVTMGSIAYADFDVSSRTDLFAKSERPDGLPRRPLDDMEWGTIWDQE